MKRAMNRDSSLVGCDVFLGDALSTFQKDICAFIFTLTTKTQHAILRNVGWYSPKDNVKSQETQILRYTAVI